VSEFDLGLADNGGDQGRTLKWHLEERLGHGQVELAIRRDARVATGQADGPAANSNTCPSLHRRVHIGDRPVRVANDGGRVVRIHLHLVLHETCANRIMS